MIPKFEMCIRDRYNTVPCGIIQFTTSPEHRIINANRRAWEIYGYSEEAVSYTHLGKDKKAFVP